MNYGMPFWVYFILQPLSCKPAHRVCPAGILILRNTYISSFYHERVSWSNFIYIFCIFYSKYWFKIFIFFFCVLITLYTTEDIFAISLRHTGSAFPTRSIPYSVSLCQPTMQYSTHHLPGFHFICTWFILCNRGVKFVCLYNTAGINASSGISFMNITISSSLTILMAAAPGIPHRHKTTSHSVPIS